MVSRKVALTSWVPVQRGPLTDSSPAFWADCFGSGGRQGARENVWVEFSSPLCSCLHLDLDRQGLMLAPLSAVC